MSKLPEGAILVRIDKKVWEEWCKFCEDKGYLSSKWAGFRLEDYMKNQGWEQLKTGQDASKGDEE